MAKSSENASFSSNVLYQDRFVKVSKGVISIKTFYFPTGQSRHVDPSQIKALNYDRDQKFGFTTKKGWGMSLSPVWWACDLCRQFRSKPDFCDVTLDIGENTDKGFSVENIGQFLDAIVPILNPGTKISDKLPY